MEKVLYSPPGAPLRSVELKFSCPVVPGTRDERVWKATFNDRIYSGPNKASVEDAFCKGEFETIEVDFAALGERVQALTEEQQKMVVEMIRLCELKNNIYKQVERKEDLHQAAVANLADNFDKAATIDKSAA